VSEPATILSLPLTEEEEKLAKLIAEILVNYVLEKTNKHEQG
jgi:hypothetical protein